MIDKALGIDDRPCVIDFRVDPTEMCFPMVPAGASNDDIIIGPSPAQMRSDSLEDEDLYGVEASA